MTYHQPIVTQTQTPAAWVPSAPAKKPEVPVTVLEEILDDVRQSLAHNPAAAQAGIARLLAILDRNEVVAGFPAYARGGFAPWQRRRVETYLTDNLEGTVQIKTLAKMVSLSASHFCRAFKQTFGRTPHNYLTGLRVERAKQLMRSTAEPLSQIALACGLADQAHLCKVFRRCVGHTPSAWRRLHQVA
jgi:AraC-like DNA-binding protein